MDSFLSASHPRPAAQASLLPFHASSPSHGALSDDAPLTKDELLAQIRATQAEQSRIDDDIAHLLLDKAQLDRAVEVLALQRPLTASEAAAVHDAPFTPPAASAGAASAAARETTVSSSNAELFRDLPPDEAFSALHTAALRVARRVATSSATARELSRKVRDIDLAQLRLSATVTRVEAVLALHSLIQVRHFFLI